MTILLIVFRSQTITYIDAVVNSPITLLCTIECPGESKWTSFFPVPADIAFCDKEGCRIEDQFQKRFSFAGDRAGGNISLLISPVVYIDRGSYRCSCDGKTAEVKLKVFVPTVVTAHELEDVSLPCFGDTRKDAKDVLWKKNGRPVLLYDHESGAMTPGQGFGSRFRLSPEAFQDGDLALHISPIHRSDAGLYLCSIHDESTDGEPHAVLLKVEESSRPWYSRVVVIMAASLLVLFALVLICWKRTVPCQGNSHPANPHPVQEENQNLSQPIPKTPSSTQPF